MSCAPVASHSAITSSPPTTSDSLLASATSIPSVSATIVGPSPAEPTIALSTRSAPGLGHEPHEPLGPGEHLAARPRLGGAGGGVGVPQRDPVDAVGARLRDQRLVRSAPRDSPTSSNASGARATTSSAWCRSSPSSRGSGAASSGDPVWHGPPCGRLRMAAGPAGPQGPDDFPRAARAAAA